MEKPTYEALVEALDVTAAWLILRHTDNASDDDVQEAIDNARDLVSAAKS